MGGRITQEVARLQEEGIPVIALKMAGSVPGQADMVVTDPIQAGTFAVMHVASTAVFLRARAAPGLASRQQADDKASLSGIADHVEQ